MLRKYMLLRAADANQDAGGSSNSADDKGADSSQQQQDGQDSQQDDSSKDDSQSDEGQQDADESSDVDTGDDKTGDQQDNQSQQNDADVVVDKEEDKSLPFHNHPRFQEIIRQKTEANQQVEQQKPLVQQATALNGFLQENAITPQEFQSALQYLQALRRNPQAAYEMLRPTYEKLAMFAGDRLPDDLQAKVAAGTLDPNDAKDIARARAQQQYSQVQQQWQQQGNQQMQGNVVATTTSSWVSTKQSVDPDFKQGTQLWEQTDLRLKAMTPSSTAQEAWQNCETAYKAAKEMLAKLQPRQQPRQQKGGLQSQQKASGNNFVVKTAEDVARLIGKGVRPNQLKYS